jgi:hypothetical protein
MLIGLSVAASLSALIVALGSRGMSVFGVSIDQVGVGVVGYGGGAGVGVVICCASRSASCCCMSSIIAVVISSCLAGAGDDAGSGESCWLVLVRSL